MTQTLDSPSRAEHAPASPDAARRRVLELADAGRTRRAAKLWTHHLWVEAERASRDWDAALRADYRLAAPDTALSSRAAATSAAFTAWTNELIDYGVVVAVARLVDAFRDAE